MVAREEGTSAGGNEIGTVMSTTKLACLLYRLCPSLPCQTLWNGARSVMPYSVLDHAGVKGPLRARFSCLMPLNEFGGGVARML
jgi:hypothetical protein